MSQSLFNITLERRLLMDALEAADGELSDELAEQLAVNRDDFETKLESYAYLIQDANSTIEAGQKEIERISLLIASKQKMVTRLESTLLDAVKSFGQRSTTKGGKDVWSARAGLFTARTAVSQSLQITDETKVPKMYWITPERPPQPADTIVKKMVTDDIKLGKTVEGAELRTNYKLDLK
jgi:hypothetical protein